MKLNKTSSLVALATFVLGAAGGLAARDHIAYREPASSSASQPVSTATPINTSAMAVAIAPNYRAIVAQNAPAVVGITTEARINISEPFSGDVAPQPFPWGLPDNDPFFRFFRDLPIPRGKALTRALGSGFIISPDGLILTNAHVVRDAKRVTVKLSDRREFQATVLGSDPVTDIAVLKIDAHHLPTVRLGNSDQLAVGDYVLAIGQPYGFEESATAGIVSAKGRSLPGDTAVPFIQTDVAVNPGNSGGPLFDSQGDVVGINAQIYTTTGGYEGLSFAIPINVALHAKDEIVRTGKVEHAQLGVEVQSLTPDLAASFGRPDASGALIAKVSPDSAAARADLKTGDVILSYNHQPVIDAGDLSAKVGMAAPGDSVTLELWRDGKVVTAHAQLASAAPSAAAARNTSSSPGPRGRLGLAVRPLTQDERAQAGVNGGLLVQEVSGHAAEAGIEDGDIVLAVDGTAVTSATQLRAAVSGHDKQVALLIQRGDERLFIPVELG
jgi:serine protease Do